MPCSTQLSSTKGDCSPTSLQGQDPGAPSPWPSYTLATADPQRRAASSRPWLPPECPGALVTKAGLGGQQERGVRAPGTVWPPTSGDSQTCPPSPDWWMSVIGGCQPHNGHGSGPWENVRSQGCTGTIPARARWRYLPPCARRALPGTASSTVHSGSCDTKPTGHCQSWHHRRPLPARAPATRCRSTPWGSQWRHNRALTVGSTAGLKHDTVSNARRLSAPELSLGVTPRTVMLPRKVHRNATLHGPGTTRPLAELRAPLEPTWLPCTGHSLDLRGPPAASTALRGDRENLQRTRA